MRNKSVNNKKQIGKLFKKVKTNTIKVLSDVKPIVKSIGNKTKMVAKTTAPYVEKGLSSVYGTLATGFDMGITGVEYISKSRKSRKSRKSKMNKTKTQKRKTQKRQTKK